MSTAAYQALLESKAVSAPERGFDKRKPRPSPDWLRQQYEVLKRDCAQIGRELKIDPKTAWEWVRAAGIQTRKRGFGHPPNLFVKGECGGMDNAHAGHNHSAEVRAIIGAASRERKAVPYLKNGVHWLKGRTGSINPHWKGGITPERQEFYRSQEWKDCVKAVWKRDNAICRHCSLDYRKVDRKTGRFDLHHVDSFAIVERRAVVENLVLLCADCHYWVHSKPNTLRLYLGDGHAR